jgi:predicted site-specific integrase-resolvase
MTYYDIINMKSYSVTEAGKDVKVSVRTIQRWVQDGHIPRPKEEIVDGQLVKSWTEKEMITIREFRASFYRGKGMDRRKGSRAKQKKVKKAK